MMTHELHGSVGQSAHGGADEVEGALEEEALGNGCFGSFFYFEEGGNAGKPGLFAETAPDHHLLENFLLRRVGYAPNDIAIPDVLKTIAYAGATGKIRHHGVCQFEFDVAVEGVDQFVFGWEVGE